MRSATRFLLLIWSCSVPVAGQSAHEAVADLAIGRKIFESQCTVCHGQGGTGGRGPSLTRPTLAKAPDEAALRNLIKEGLLPEMPGSWQLSVREIASVAAYVRSLGSVKPEVLPGDPARGTSVYRAKGCAGCHILSGQGIGLGPELTAIGAKRNAAYLRASIRTPAESLPDDYLLVEVVTTGGRSIRGVRANEDPFSIQLRDLGAGQFVTFPKSELTGVRYLDQQSSMPAYPEKVLSNADLDDLIAYLASQRGESK